jgi:hypothetical protein
MIEIKDQDEEAKAEVTPLDLRKNVKKKKAIKVAKAGIPGDIAHYHKKENAVEEWEEPCFYVEHKVSVPGGLRLNEVDYAGKVIVPQCTADYLAWQESEKLRYEQGIFRSKKISRKVASL